ncbi:probable serine/threonine-protein kinase PBL7 [Olea europaea var. sylvestris]|uniref:probable serine/threonine-protein kinase PBL7 n=1 Tax=Olea europaea var. sylvestris TaxID=158386 RepID=UPI000C1CFEB9|nr:probable serine/threonine-protein kinase PBL7 [Olea europaea var. sylvestris]
MNTGDRRRFNVLDINSILEAEFLSRASFKMSNEANVIGNGCTGIVYRTKLDAEVIAPGKSPSRTRWRLLGVGREVLDYIRRAQGLAYLHPDCVPPIIHKDIKANNILIGLDFKPYIADLGLSKLLDDGGFGWSSNTVASPYGYIAPHGGKYLSSMIGAKLVTEGKKNFGTYNLKIFLYSCFAKYLLERFDPNTYGGNYNGYARDIWSLGLTLLELFMGHFPYLLEGQRPDWATLMCAICIGEPPNLLEVHQKISRISFSVIRRRIPVNDGVQPSCYHILL